VWPFVPERRRGREILDDPGIDPDTRLRSLADVARSNRLFGGRRAAVNAVRPALGSPGPTPTLLDVGTGVADIPAAIVARAGGRLTTVGLDESADLLAASRHRIDYPVCGSARALPFRNRSVDVVLCSQLLHHFADDELAPIIRELDRVARTRVIIADIRRSWLAAAGFWLASFPLRFHPVTRHDGVVSVFRGFTAGELRGAIVSAVGAIPVVERRLGFRLTASWRPAHRG
jgi:SAM-dependent methyltransferase